MKPRNCSRCNTSPFVEQLIVKGNLCYLVICPRCHKHATLCFRMENAIIDWNTKLEKEKTTNERHTY